MKKYKLNLYKIVRNIEIIGCIIASIISNNQIKQNEIELSQINNNTIIDTVEKYDNFDIYNYTAVEENLPEINSNELKNKIYLGNFKITHYCACTKCCGPNAKGITASGKKVEEGKTIAVDTKVIKLGSAVYIDGYGEYEAQDTGSAIKGNIIDVYVADHNEALKMGVEYKDVYLIEEVK